MFTLLVVSNRPNERQFLESRLERQGYRVVSYEWQEPLERCLDRLDECDAVFLAARDAQLLGKLKAHPTTKSAAIICLASNTSPLVDDRECDVVLRNPRGQEALLQALVEVTQKRGEV